MVALIVGIVAGILDYFVFSKKRVAEKRKQMILRQYSEGKNLDFLGEHELTIDDQGLLSKSSYSEGKYKWAAVEKVINDKTHLYLFTGSNKAIIINKTSLLDGNIDSFISELDKYSHVTNSNKSSA